MYKILIADDEELEREALRFFINESSLDIDQVIECASGTEVIKRVMLDRPDIIVLDEPTSFLDIRYKLEFLSIIQNMSRTRHLSVIMSLHELDLAGRISDKIACVHGDRVDRFGTPEEIFTDGYIAVNIAATDLTVKSAVLGLAVSAISAGMGILKKTVDIFP